MTEELHVNKTRAETKASVFEAIDDLQTALIDLSRRIHRNPEIKFEEHRASRWLSDAAKEAGFRVEKPIGGLDTAFRASYTGAGEGLTLAFLAEYDALPKLGHGCGHNLIGPASLGAALGMQTEMDDLPGSIQLIGTPGEEGGGGKVILAEAGVFDQVDVAMMFHPSGKTILWKHALARRKLFVEFFGKAAHAAAFPEKGISALDATLLTFQNINALREHIVDSSRVHGIITHGGDAPNVVPDYSSCLFYVRAFDDAYCDELLEKVKNCARGAALVTGARVEMDIQGAYKSLRPSMPLAQAFKRNLEALGWTFDEVNPARGIGSTDMGDVSHITPSLHPYLSIGPRDLVGHSTEFAAAAASREGFEAMMTAAKGMAATAVDVLLQPELYDAIRADFDARGSWGPAEAQGVSRADNGNPRLVRTGSETH
jgi:amidohydrolase